MPIVSVRGDMREILKDLPRVRRGVVPRVASQVLNRNARDLEGRAVKAAAGALPGIPQKMIRGRIKRRNASPKFMSARRYVKLSPIKAAALGVPKKTRAGVTVKRLRFPGAFVAKGSRGLDVFKRTGSARLPIASQRIGIRSSVTGAFEREFVAAGPAAFKPEFTRRLKLELRKRRAR